MHRLAHCLVACLCGLPSLAARDIFVNNVSGDDRVKGTMAAPESGTFGPVRSIAKALRLATPGDRVVVANTGQPYRESISLTGDKHSGGAIGPFVVEGNGATLDGSASLEDVSWTYEGGDVFAFQPARLGYQQLLLGGERRAAVRHPVERSSVTLPPLEPLEWCLWESKLHFRVEPNRAPRQYQLACCKLQTGVTLYHVHDVVVQNLVIQGFAVDGCSAADGVPWAQLRGLTCRANGRNGISVTGASRIAIEGCTLRENGQGQLRIGDGSHTTVAATRLVDDTAPAVVRYGGEIAFDERPRSPRQP